MNFLINIHLRKSRSLCTRRHSKLPKHCFNELYSSNVAGVKNIYLTTPALDSKINPAIVYAAKKCGVKKIYKTGGAHTIAALAYGTKNLKKLIK